MNEGILFVDDDPNILEGYQRKLQHVLRVRTAQGAHLGLREIQEKGPFAVVVADMNMPLMNGIEFLKRVREMAPDTVRMMLTGNSDVKTAMDAVNEGCVFRFLTKPCPSKLMGDSLLAAIQQYRLVTSEKELLAGTLSRTAELLAEVLSWVNPEAFGRTVQLRNTALSIAYQLKVKDEWEIGLAATLSQLGVMAIPGEILVKMDVGAPMTDEEKNVFESIPGVGHDLIERIPRLEDVAKIILYQRKCFNGDGFPSDEVKEANLPLGARILKVANDFHELRATGLDRAECIKQMKGRAGHYDPSVLQIFEQEKTAALAEGRPSQVVPFAFADLQAGAILASPIETSTGRTLIVEGTVVSEALLIRLRKYTETNGIRQPIQILVPG